MKYKLLQTPLLSRRQMIKNTGSFLFVAPFFTLFACQGENTSDTDTTDSSNDVTDSDSETSDSASSETSSDTKSTETTIAWAAGGTGLITVAYPDDGLFDNTGVCNLSLTESTTEGPCYFGVNETEDIASGRTGLPMMLCLQLVDQACNPLQGYLIEVWHCDSAGVYSGDTTQSDDVSTFAGSFCTGGDTEAEASTWFRGEQTTDSSGRVNFKTCFPGWYRGRTIHIHFRVRLEYGGSDYVISQFCFSDSFAEEICTNHRLYANRGVQDTPLASGNDTVFPATDYNEFILNIDQNSDGTLLAYKRISIEV
jgi:protocatechuate 3,4-dioxygenase beta subunit